MKTGLSTEGRVEAIPGSNRASLDFQSLLESYEAVAVIANSDAVDLPAIAETMPESTIFIFTSHSGKIMRQGFKRDSAVIHRMHNKDICVARLKHLNRLAQHLPPQTVKGEVGFFSDFVNAPGRQTNAGHKPETPLPVIDMNDFVAEFYSSGLLASTGFVLALWLAYNITRSKVYLCGFTGVRGDRLPNSTIHDWTLEQTVLRIFYRTGRLLRYEDKDKPSDRLSRLQERFGPIPDFDLAMIAHDVNATEISNSESAIALLWSANRFLREISDGLKKLRFETEDPKKT